jgi:uncharacterized protein with HEPN domain
MPSDNLVVSSLLKSFFEAGWAIQVLLGDADRTTYEASRITRPQAERHLQAMVDVAGALPAAVRELMPLMDWDSWVELGQHLPPRNAHDRDLIWTAVSVWLPPAGAVMRRYRRELPQLWRFQL